MGPHAPPSPLPAPPADVSEARAASHVARAATTAAAGDPRPRRRATHTRPHGVRHLFAAYDLARDKLYGHVKNTKNRSKFLEFCRYLHSLYPQPCASRSWWTTTLRT